MVWEKLFTASSIRSIRFPSNRDVLEDEIFAYRQLSALKFFHISLKRYTVTGRDLIQSFAMNDSLGKCLRGERFV